MSEPLEPFFRVSSGASFVSAAVAMAGLMHRFATEVVTRTQDGRSYRIRQWHCTTETEDGMQELHVSGLVLLAHEREAKRVGDCVPRESFDSSRADHFEEVAELSVPPVVDMDAPIAGFICRHTRHWRLVRLMVPGGGEIIAYWRLESIT